MLQKMNNVQWILKGTQLHQELCDMCKMCDAYVIHVWCFGVLHFYTCNTAMGVAEGGSKFTKPSARNHCSHFTDPLQISFEFAVNF